MKVSVCVPAYNGARFIGEALDSILYQTFRDFELIVSDDASDDETLAVVARRAEPRVRVERNPSRLGLVGNWNRCLALAAGEYVCLFHQDDLMEPELLARQVALLDARPSIGFVFANVSRIDERGETVGGHWNRSLPRADTIYAGSEVFRRMLSGGNLVPCQTVMARAVCYRALGGFNPRLHYTPDFEMWLRLALHGDVGYLAAPLARIRLHGEQASRPYVGNVEEVHEVHQALQVVFVEQAAYIRDRDLMYALAMRHLRRWLLMFLRAAVRRGQLRRAFAWTRELAQVLGAQRRGLDGLRAQG
ncbi:MAG: glycosyltransferase [Chloroflexi bacterium]|nr:MAG: glycosyltransferase [Chloroflexota bacterium]